MEANERRSGKPSSIAENFDLEIAESLDSSGEEELPTETVANESEIPFSEDLDIDILDS